MSTIEQQLAELTKTVQLLADKQVAMQQELDELRDVKKEIYYQKFLEKYFQA